MVLIPSNTVLWCETVDMEMVSKCIIAQDSLPTCKAKVRILQG